MPTQPHWIEKLQDGALAATGAASVTACISFILVVWRNHVALRDVRRQLDDLRQATEALTETMQTEHEEDVRQRDRVMQTLVEALAAGRCATCPNNRLRRADEETKQ